MRIDSVAFFGHRYVDNIIKVENLLEEQIRRLIDENEYVDFLVGRNGDFDQCVSSMRHQWHTLNLLSKFVTVKWLTAQI